jgi:hypothetical protein
MIYGKKYKLRVWLNRALMVLKVLKNDRLAIFTLKNVLIQDGFPSWTFLLSAYMKFIREIIGFIPKILKFVFAQNMFFTDKKS